MRISLAAALLLALFPTSGCATVMTAKTIYPGEGEDSDEVSKVNTAWRDDAGNITLCVTGMPAGVNFWLGRERNYSIHYPAASSPRLEARHRETVPEYRVTAADVGRGCPNDMKGMTPLPIHHIRARDFAAGENFEVSYDAQAKFFNERAEAPAVYVLDRRENREYGRDWTSFFHVREAPLKGNARVVEITTRKRKKEGNVGYVLMLPAAVAFDIVSSPVQLLVAVMLTRWALSGARM